ncbi:hypothetical protein CEXT_194681 [Caerostris extrusa]|uniref:Uncharacterized protein n=1 Tax=Caerostris extrusa TaxID=172846 RepID=A0AAV4XFA7_CAEEX|nr:hypothetical protein CEXT_194681 [Caerostris extrusa]
MQGCDYLTSGPEQCPLTSLPKEALDRAHLIAFYKSPLLQKQKTKNKEKGYGHSMMNLVYLLMRLSSESRKSEEGPFAPSACCPRFLTIARPLSLGSSSPSHDRTAASACRARNL